MAVIGARDLRTFLASRTTSFADLPVEDLEHAVGDALEEVAVVADRDHRAVEGLQRGLERLDGWDVEVVGRLVEDEAVRPREHQQQAAQARALAAAHPADGAAELLV